MNLDLDVDDNLRSRKVGIRTISRCDVARLCIAALSVSNGRNSSFDCVNKEVPEGSQRMTAEESLKEFLASEEAVEVQDYLDRSKMNASSIVDCMMTSICTDRSLPSGMYTPNPGNMFHRISNFRTLRDSFHIRHNDGEYAKLQSSILWAEIMDHILPVVDTEEDDRRRPHPTQWG